MRQTRGEGADGRQLVGMAQAAFQFEFAFAFVQQRAGAPRSIRASSLRNSSVIRVTSSPANSRSDSSPLEKLLTRRDSSANGSDTYLRATNGIRIAVKDHDYPARPD